MIKVNKYVAIIIFFNKILYNMILIFLKIFMFL